MQKVNTCVLLLWQVLPNLGKNKSNKSNAWEFSSVGSEHLPYKQRVGGSNPSTPT